MMRSTYQTLINMVSNTDDVVTSVVMVILLYIRIFHDSYMGN